MLRSAARRLLAPGRGLRGTASGSAGQFDVAVVGGGVMGSWAAARVAARGASCVLLDQFEPGHENGSSHGDGRIYRFAYEEDVYVDMMGVALKHWHALQAFAGSPMLAKTGGLSINYASARGSANDKLTRLQQMYDRRGLANERLDAGAAAERFPQFQLQGGTGSETLEALYQPDMGVLFATKCVKATWDYAKSLGATARPNTTLTSLTQDAAGVVLKTADGEDITARKVILAPGSWLSGMAELLLGLKIPTQVTAETVSYFARKDGCEVDHTYHSMPVFINYVDNGLGPHGTYGLPAIDIPGVKTSAHHCGPKVLPGVARPKAAGGPGASAEEEASSAARIADVVGANRRCIQGLFANVEDEPFLSQSCLYTCTPDHDYVIGVAPGHANVILAGGGSGHAFKMGPAIGEACACLAMGEPAPVPLEGFAVERLLGSAAPSWGTGVRR